MLWLCLHLPLLPHAALADARADAAVVEQRGAQRWLITPSRHSPAGTPLAQALRLEPELALLPRRPAAEHAALRALAHTLYNYGQPVTAEIADLAEPGRLPRALLWVEIGRSLRLFGGLDALRARLCAELPALGHAEARTGVAPTRAGAALLACAGQHAPVTERSALAARLAALPLHALHWPGERLHALRGVGLRRLGELLAIPRADFVKRFGAEARLDLDRLLGDAPEPCAAWVPPETFHRRLDLGAEIEDSERLRFPLHRLCAELQGYLRARDRGVTEVSLAVRHAGARETRVHARFVDAHRDARRLFDALHERLSAVIEPARELVLMAEAFAEARVPQADWIDPHRAEPQRWSAAVERIRARLGEARAWTPQAVEDHRPEHATRRAQDAAPSTFNAAAHDAHRPSLLLPQPWPMPAPALPDSTRFERIESGWWDEREQRRDYLALDLDGARAWVFRDLRTQGWYLHGWFA